MDAFWIVKSKSGRHAEFGYPIGQCLVHREEDIEKTILENQINDPIIEKHTMDINPIEFMLYREKYDK